MLLLSTISGAPVALVFLGSAQCPVLCGGWSQAECIGKALMPVQGKIQLAEVCGALRAANCAVGKGG